MKTKHYSFVGWIGMGLVLLGYLLITLKIINYSGFLFLSLNILGSFGLAIISFRKKSISLTFFYSAWAIISIINFIKILI